MKLRRPCEHGRYDDHWMQSAGELPSGVNDAVSCPGGVFLPDDALIIEKLDGEWPSGLKRWIGLLDSLLDMQQAETVLTESS